MKKTEDKPKKVSSGYSPPKLSKEAVNAATEMTGVGTSDPSKNEKNS